MKYAEALAIAEQLLAVGERYVLELTTKGDHIKFTKLYGEGAAEFERLLPQQTFKVGSGTYSNVVEAAFIGMLGSELNEGFLQLTRLVGRLRELAKKGDQSDASVVVDDNRLSELSSLEHTAYDFSRLVRLCEELNVTFATGCYIAVALLTRAILDHVPPVFGLRTFSEVANNHGGRSFKETMEYLEKVARKIADAHLHTPIRASEALPTGTQVNFSNALDVLLAEVVRVSSKSSSA